MMMLSKRFYSFEIAHWYQINSPDKIIKYYIYDKNLEKEVE